MLFVYQWQPAKLKLFTIQNLPFFLLYVRHFLIRPMIFQSDTFLESTSMKDAILKSLNDDQVRDKLK